MMNIINFVLYGLGWVAALPSVLLLPAVVVTGIIGMVKKDYTYLKKYLKFWGYSLIVLLGILAVYMGIQFVISKSIVSSPSIPGKLGL